MSPHLHGFQLVFDAATIRYVLRATFNFGRLPWMCVLRLSIVRFARALEETGSCTYRSMHSAMHW
jgi:hypothetical protein